MTQDNSDARLYGLPEAAKELGGISVWSLRKHISRGNIRTVRLGRRVAIPSQEIARIQRQGLPSLVPAAAHVDQGKGTSSRAIDSSETTHRDGRISPR